VKELEKEGFPVHMRKEEAIIHMWWVLGPDGRTPPTKDKRVREALNLAIDRAEVAQSIFGGYAEPAAIPMGLSWSFKEVGFKVTPPSEDVTDISSDGSSSSRSVLSGSGRDRSFFAAAR
jgi:ABC-type transport system substrate-binding protein